MECKTVDSATVIQIHDHLVSYFCQSKDPIAPPGVRDNALLESAAYVQHTGFDGTYKYDTPTKNAAALIYSICNNHPFYNGNKRTALLAGLMHLDLNGLVFRKVSRDRLFKLMVDIASHRLLLGGQTPIRRRPNHDEEVARLGDWLTERSTKIVRGEKSITFTELYRIINGFEHLKVGSHPKGNKIDILEFRKTLFGKKWTCVYKCAYPGGGKTVQIDEIKKIRRTLKLDEDNGIDTISFYGKQTVIDSLIRDHRKVLRRLAHA